MKNNFMTAKFKWTIRVAQYKFNIFFQTELEYNWAISSSNLSIQVYASPIRFEHYLKIYQCEYHADHKNNTIIA